MKSLRVLNGLHAGACQALAPGRYRIAAGGAEAPPEQGDAPGVDALGITLLDWVGSPLLLHVTAGGPVQATTAVDMQSEPVPSCWPDHQPRRFGELVLCIGDDAASWPRDADLLALMAFHPVVPKLPRSTRPGAWGARAGMLGAGVLVTLGAFYGRAGTAAPEPPTARPDVVAHLLTQGLAGRGLDELQVTRERQDVVLSGLVQNAREAQLVRLAVAVVEQSTGMPIVSQWEVADDVASTIVAALRAPGVHARYAGAGRFRVEGVVADPVGLSATGGALAKDLGSNVKGIDFALLRRQKSSPFSSAVASGELRYSERPDGAKVFPALSERL